MSSPGSAGSGNVLSLLRNCKGFLEKLGAHAPCVMAYPNNFLAVNCPVQKDAVRVWAMFMVQQHDT